MLFLFLGKWFYVFINSEVTGFDFGVYSVKKKDEQKKLYTKNSVDVKSFTYRIL